MHPVNQRCKSHRVYGHLVHEIREFSSYHCRYESTNDSGNFSSNLGSDLPDVSHVLFSHASVHVHKISQSDGYKERTSKKEVAMSSE